MLSVEHYEMGNCDQQILFVISDLDQLRGLVLIFISLKYKEYTTIQSTLQ